MQRNNKKPKTGLLFIPLLVFGLIALFIIAGKYLVYSDPLEPADVMAVLSGNDVSRIREAAVLYHEGISYNIILSRTDQTFGEYDLPYTMLQKEMLDDMNIPDGAVYVSEVTAKNTGQEASGIKKRMYDLGYSSVIVITDAWHSRRAKIIFMDSFRNTGFKVSVHPVPDSGYNKYLWWFTPSGWEHTVSEYIRLLGYIIKRDTNIPDYPNF